MEGCVKLKLSGWRLVTGCVRKKLSSVVELVALNELARRALVVVVVDMEKWELVGNAVALDGVECRGMGANCRGDAEV